ncbi:MAG TPA: O-methyltransferase [Bryobacteraceae bacterium]|nr:O-methyltransferase [Bryobacteraceae bacterium]
MIVNPEIERYMERLLPARDAVLQEMEEQAARRNIPIIGPTVARVLAQLVMISKAKRIFELGSAIGYSTVWLARAAGPAAEIHYSDGSAQNAREAVGYFERAGLTHLIQVHVGDALTSLAQTAGEFDLIFNDVNKEGYPTVLAAIPTRLKSGGLFVTDNTLWHERVLNPQEESDLAVTSFNRQLYDSAQFFTVLLPIRDGVSVSLKL